MKNLKICFIMMMLVGFASLHSAKAQVFILNDEEYTKNTRTPSEVGGATPIVPIQDLTVDQYVPLGGGLGLLCGFGLALALYKKRKAK